MNSDFWNEEYFLHPDFDDMYAYASMHPEQVYMFYPSSEVEYGEDLFYQLCISGEYPHSQYLVWEKNLGEIIADVIKKDRIVAFASSRTFDSCKNACKLTGLKSEHLQKLIRFCDSRQSLTTQTEINKFLLCITRGIASTCALAADWKILFLMQDLHGCIILQQDSDKNGLQQIINTFQSHEYIIETRTGDGLREPRDEGTVLSSPSQGAPS